MMEKLNRLSTAAYVKAAMLGADLKRKAKDLWEDERGLSGVVVAVLLILVAVLAVVFLWDGLKQWLTDMWNKIVNQGNGISGP